MKSPRVLLVLAGAIALLGLTVLVRSIDRAPTSAVERLDTSSLTFKDMNGADVKLADYAGRPLIINLWATWCGPCRLEMPQLVELSKKYAPRGLAIVGVSVDDTPDQIKAFAKEFSVTYPLLVGLGNDRALETLGYDGNVPMTIFVKRDGTILERMLGINTTDTWERRIEALF